MYITTNQTYQLPKYSDTTVVANDEEALEIVHNVVTIRRQYARVMRRCDEAMKEQGEIVTEWKEAIETITPFLDFIK